MKKNIIIIVLLLVILGLGGYLVYDKIKPNELKKDMLDKSETQNEKTETDEITKEEIDKKDEKYFDSYLKPFMSCEGESVTRNTQSFNDEDISNFVSRYYNLKMAKQTTGIEGSNSYSVKVDEVDELVYRYFNTKDYNLKSVNHYKIVKKDGAYEFTWLAVGCGYIQYKNPIVTYNNEIVTVKYELYSIMENRYTNEFVTFYLKYNNGNYNIVKIEK